MLSHSVMLVCEEMVKRVDKQFSAYEEELQQIIIGREIVNVVSKKYECDI